MAGRHPKLGLCRHIHRFDIEGKQGICHKWSSILEFDISLTDAQITTLVQNALVEMQAQCKGAIWRSKKNPRAMTALASPDRTIIFLASSMKKLAGDLPAKEYFYSDPQIAALLNQGRPK